MKTNRHTLLAKGIMVLLALLVMIFALSYSWFIPPDMPAVATGITAGVADPGADFEYAIGFYNSRTTGEYKRTAFVNDPTVTLNLRELTADDGHNTQYDLLYDYQPIDLSGDGVTLIRPAMNYGNWSINLSSDNYSIAEPNVQYLSFDLIVRANSACKVSLSENSYAFGACELTPGNGALNLGNSAALTNEQKAKINKARDGNVTLSDEEAYNQSQYGGFSRDAIVGATRVAFVNYTDDVTGAEVKDERQTTLSSTPALLWVPRPDVYLNNNNNDSSTSGWSLNTGVTPNQTFNLISDSHTENPYSTYVHQYYSIINSVAEGQPLQKTLTTLDPNAQGSYVKASSIVNENGTTTVKLNQSVKIMDVNVPDDEDNDGEADYYYGKVNIRVWIEGSDSEARRALSGGDFGIHFDLTSH